MKVYDYTTVRPQMGTTKTYEEFHKFLGSAPHRLGVVSKMFPNLTATYLTEALLNIHTNSNSSSNRFQSINAFSYEWDLDTQEIKRIAFVDVPQGNGENGSLIRFAFKENYYQKYDTFRMDEGSRQSVIVLHKPERVHDNYWVVWGQLIDNDYSSLLDVSACQPGMETRFISNYHPELSEEGYTKYQSSTEKHRNYISTHRNDISWSSQFAATEEMFIGLAKNKGKGSDEEVLYKIQKKEKELLDSFIMSRNNALVFGKTNVDVNGKSTVVDPHTQRPIYMGDGVIAQIERYANKYAYARLSINAFDTILEHLRTKSASPTDNQYTFIVNEKLWTQINRVLRDYLKDWKTDGTFFYSKVKNNEVKVGARFTTYEIDGNQLTFHVDKALTLEYPNKGYGIIVDLTADKTSNTPAMQMFTVKNGEFIRGFLRGVGGEDGTTSGDIYTTVAGSKLVHMGYASVGIYNPYRSYIIMEN